MRDEITFTIDGADAKDLDDAVHIKALKMVIWNSEFTSQMFPTM